MIDYTIKEEYLLKGWIFKGTINFRNSIPTDIIYTDDFSIRIVNPVTFYGKTILNIPSSESSDVEIPVNEAMLKDLGYGTSADDELGKIEANLIKNGGVTFIMTDKSITVYLLPSYKFNDRAVQSFDIAQIIVTFRLNNVLEQINMCAGILPSVRRSNNFTVYKLDNVFDSVFPTDKSRVINPVEEDDKDLLPTSGYNFNETFIEHEISTSANFNYDETVDGLYVSPNVSSTNEDNPAAYASSAVVYTPIGDYKIELSSYLTDPYKGTIVPVSYNIEAIQESETLMFNISANDTQVEYYEDFFSTISGNYYANYNASAVVQKIWPNDLQSIQNRLTLECNISDPDEE